MLFLAMKKELEPAQSVSPTNLYDSAIGNINSTVPFNLCPLQLHNPIKGYECSLDLLIPKSWSVLGLPNVVR